MASAFAALAHRKLKSGGTLALVLPLTASAASSWRAFRQMLARDFTDLMVLSIAANGRDMSFSSDTGMAECLVLAPKMPKSSSSMDPVCSTTKERQAVSLHCAIAHKGLHTLLRLRRQSPQVTTYGKFKMGRTVVRR